MAEARATLYLEVIRSDYQGVVDAAAASTAALVAAQAQVIASAPKVAAARNAEATAAKAQTDAMKAVEKAYVSALAPHEKTRKLLEEIQEIRFDDVESTSKQAVAIAHLSDKLDDQTRRFEANRGSQNKLSRSLAELLDEQTKAQTAAIAAGAALLREGQTAEKTALALAHLKATTDAADKSSAAYTADVDRLETQLKDLNAATDAQRASVSKMESILSSLPGPVGEAGASFGSLKTALTSTAGQAGLVVTVGAAVVAGMLSMSAAAAENTDKIAKLAEVTGLNAAELSRYQQLAEKSLPSGGIEKFAEGIQKLASPAGAKALEELGIQGDTTSEKLENLAQWYVETGNTAERSAALTKIYGDGLARELAPALAQGADGIRKLAKENDDFGRTIDSYSLAVTASYKDAQQELGGATKGLGQEFETLTPILTAGYDVMRTGVETVTSLVRGVKAAGDGIGFFAAVLGSWAGTSKTWDEAADEVAAGLEADADAADRGIESQGNLIPIVEKSTEAHKDYASSADLAAKALEHLNEVQNRLNVADNLRIEAIAETMGAEADAGQAFVDAYDLRIDTVTDFEDDVTASIQRISAKELKSLDERRKAQQSYARTVGGLLQNSADAAVGLINLVGGETDRSARRAFAVTQAAAVGSAVVNTFLGITSALAEPVPTPIKYANAIAIGVAGAASVAGILSTSFGGGSGSSFSVSAPGSSSGTVGSSSGGQGFSDARSQYGVDPQSSNPGGKGSLPGSDSGGTPTKNTGGDIPVTDAYIGRGMAGRTVRPAEGDVLIRGGALGRGSMSDPKTLAALGRVEAVGMETNSLLANLCDLLRMQQYQAAIPGPPRSR